MQFNAISLHIHHATLGKDKYSILISDTPQYPGTGASHWPDMISGEKPVKVVRDATKIAINRLGEYYDWVVIKTSSNLKLN